MSDSLSLLFERHPCTAEESVRVMLSNRGWRSHFSRCTVSVEWREPAQQVKYMYQGKSRRNVHFAPPIHETESAQFDVAMLNSSPLERCSGVRLYTLDEPMHARSGLFADLVGLGWV
jgi:hypothetical protein